MPISGLLANFFNTNENFGGIQVINHSLKFEKIRYLFAVYSSSYAFNDAIDIIYVKYSEHVKVFMVFRYQFDKVFRKIFRYILYKWYDYFKGKYSFVDYLSG